MEIRWPESFALDETARARVESRLRALGQSVDGVQRVTILCRPNPSADGVEVRIEAVIRRKQFVAVRRRAELEPTMDEAIEAFASCLRLAAAEEIAPAAQSQEDLDPPDPRARRWRWGHGAIDVPRRVLAAAARLPAWQRPSAREPRRASSAPGAGTRVWHALRRGRTGNPDRGPIVLPPVIPSYVPEGAPPVSFDKRASSARELREPEPPVERIPEPLVTLAAEQGGIEPMGTEPVAEEMPVSIAVAAPVETIFRDVVQILPDVAEPEVAEPVTTVFRDVVQVLPDVVGPEPVEAAHEPRGVAAERVVIEPEANEVAPVAAVLETEPVAIAAEPAEEQLPMAAAEPRSLVAFEPIEEPVALAAAQPLPGIDAREISEPLALEPSAPIAELELEPALETRALDPTTPHAELPYTEVPLPSDLPDPSLPLYARSSPFVTGSAIAGAAVLVYLVSSPLFTMRNPSVFWAIARPAAFTAVARPPAFSAIARPRLELEESAAFSAWAGPAPRAALPQVAAAPEQPRMSFTAWAKPRSTASVRRARIGADDSDF